MLDPVPLPTNNDAHWPPQHVRSQFRDIEEAEAWWSNDTERLRRFYTAGVQNRTDRPGRRLWERPSAAPGQPDQRIHVPLASDIAQTGADLLFSEDPEFTIPEAHTERPDADAVAAEARLGELLELAGVPALLLEAAELAGGLGGVYLRPTWDPSIAAHPLLHIVAPDHAIPEWRFGQLVAVTFWQDLSVRDEEGKGRVVWRHLERHEPGWIYHGLYVGSDTKLGTRQALTRHPDTAALTDEVNLRTLLGWEWLLPSYVPNVKPNRKHKGLPVGRANCAGSEDLLDALDETWTSWMRDIRVGKARVIVPDEFLDRGGRGAGAVFDVDREVFTPLNVDPAHLSAAGITPVEFVIRTEEHAKTAADLTERIIRAAGYSPQSMGMAGQGAQVTATEVDAREGASGRTTMRKQRYFRQPLTSVASAFLAIDANVFGSGVDPSWVPQVAYPDMGGHDISAVATSVAMLHQAAAISIETGVRMAQPELDDERVAAEVARIRDEQGIMVPDPTGGLP